MLKADVTQKKYLLLNYHARMSTVVIQLIDAWLRLLNHSLAYIKIVPTDKHHICVSKSFHHFVASPKAAAATQRLQVEAEVKNKHYLASEAHDSSSTYMYAAKISWKQELFFLYVTDAKEKLCLHTRSGKWQEADPCVCVSGGRSLRWCWPRRRGLRGWWLSSASRRRR